MILDYDHLEAIRKNLALNNLIELRPLTFRAYREARGQEKQSSAPTQDTFSFGHVRFWKSPLKILRAID